MNHYNRTNPFLYILDQSNDSLFIEINAVIKNVIIMAGCFLLLVIVACVDFVLNKSLNFRDFIDLCTCLFLFLFMVNITGYAIKASKTEAIDQIKFPMDQLIYHYYNNEQMFKDTLKISTHIGIMKAIKKMSYAFMIIFGGMLLYHVKNVLSYFI